MDNVTIVFKAEGKNIKVDLEVPLDLSAIDFIESVNTAYGLEIDNIDKVCLISENPIAKLSGDKTLRDFGIRQGSIIIFKET